jgi:LmbE family N-acetylglucosaminyl deacetylase
MKTILVVSPHPDDETLGCGGTILKHKAQGAKICWLIVTNLPLTEGADKTRYEDRQKEIARASEAYGFDRVFKLDFPTTKLDALPKDGIIGAIKEVVTAVQPDTIYLPNRGDIHSDHKVTFDAVMSAAKTFRFPCIRKVMMYEVSSETDFAPPFATSAFTPNSFSDISNFLEKKISIMGIYGSELGSHPFPRSVEGIKALAMVRGAAAGVTYAEAFMTLKEIW